MGDATALPVAARRHALLVATVAGLAGGLAARAAGEPLLAGRIWAASAGVALVALVVRIARDLLRKKAGVDVLALVAMAGALLVGESLAAAIVGVMMATGEALEAYAAGRAQRELSALLSRAPAIAHRIEEGGPVTVPAGEVRPGDRLLVKAGEIVPVDGVVASGEALIDESALTGEARPAPKAAGDRVSSGTANVGDAFSLRAVATAEGSTYAGIVRLVRRAAEAKAPLSRLADRYALLFVPVSLAIAGGAWIAARDPVRAVAVLVVATPCPLLLAAPIALVAGISRAARRGILVKGGAALEALAGARALLFDKTGTLTTGVPEVAAVTAFGGADEREALRLAASLEQTSTHVVAAALVRAARSRGLALSFPEASAERAGKGMEGRVEGRAVRVGMAETAAGGGALSAEVRAFRRRATRAGAMAAFVGIDGEVACAIELDDPVRPDSPRTIRALRREGIRTIVMVTGDLPLVAESVGAALGVDRVLAQRSPEEKVAAVREVREASPVVMVGDGINDAPALAAADVGVAMGARGASASSEAADVVIVVDRLDRLVEALRVAKRSRGIALESVTVGMGLSLVAMGAAAAGLLPPVAGAVLQEAIDVVSILAALRALGDGQPGRRRAIDEGLSRRLRSEHDALIPALDRVRALADRLDALDPAAARAELDALARFLKDEVLAHEKLDDAEVYPVVAGVIGGDETLAPMSRTHQEIFHLVRVYERILEDVDPSGPGAAEIADLRRVLYGLYAILRLHFAQEEELYSSVSESYMDRDRSGADGAG